ncbi:methyltransferase domain-containing protein [Lyngbya confervoides]|uniref:Class I SAM-dependent methyltransferase n=1 Tax=Lyngbya confervoides BDU141951 TaxID=1574623 RepID=A0ABD4SY01_9CYAN|nr:methyltransferase domain-containing protein [Lyngbya confervoides]MCM1981244.1 class I SAM-dependent methyltransferase [Lyngbya confervoides BDU141951]
MLSSTSETKPLVFSWQEIISCLSNNSSWRETHQYLSSTEQENGVTIQRLWEILDQAWDEMQTPRSQADFPKFLHDYYQHPVWLINAAFSESDEGTISDRLAAVRLIAHTQPKKILDFGGGIGTVARLCSMNLPYAEKIDVVDITDFRQTIQSYLAEFPNIRVLERPDPAYDAIISTEVLEHVLDPIETVVEMNALLRIGGSFAASWSFAPCIKCHLPQNFHLNRLMPWIIRSLGFGFYGFERRGSRVYGYVKQADVTPKMMRQARWLEQVSRLPLPIDRLLLLIFGL